MIVAVGRPSPPTPSCPPPPTPPPSAMSTSLGRGKGRGLSLAAGRGQGRALVKRRRTDAARYPRNLRLVAAGDLLALAEPTAEHDADILRRLLE